MIDIGANLCNFQFDQDIANVLSNSEGLTHIILTSTDTQTYFKDLNIISQYNHLLRMSTTLGLHPHQADQYKDFFLSFDNLIQHPKIVALGEFGLDYFRMISSKRNQQITMNLFLEKSSTIKLPLFMHERNSFDDFFYILNSYQTNNKKVVHCFTSDKKTMQKYLDIECYIGVTGWITEKRGEDLRDAIRYLPMDRLMIETDCPYLTPKNMNKPIYRNEPKFLKFIVKKIAEIKNIDENLVASQTLKNSLAFFSLESTYENI